MPARTLRTALLPHQWKQAGEPDAPLLGYTGPLGPNGEMERTYQSSGLPSWLQDMSRPARSAERKPEQ
jgi:hypothetical protein